MGARIPAPLPAESSALPVNVENPSCPGKTRCIQKVSLPKVTSSTGQSHHIHHLVSPATTSNSASPISRSSSSTFSSSPPTPSIGGAHQLQHLVLPVPASSPVYSVSTSPSISSSISSISSLGDSHQVHHQTLSVSTSKSSSSIPITMAGKDQALTPPLTPSKTQCKQSSATPEVLRLNDMAATLLNSTGRFHSEKAATAKEKLEDDEHKKRRWETTVPRPCPMKYQLFDSVYGTGAWSTVYKATELRDLPPSTAPPSPPGTPGLNPSHIGTEKMLAVKVPSRADAPKILDKEARILTYLHSFSRAANFLVPFHGYDKPQYSLVYDAIPLDLDRHARNAAQMASLNFSTSTMRDPVLGRATWGRLALDLVDGLAFLHSVHCVHGDIKPANVLIHASPNSEFLIPLFCDFSSSHVAASSFGLSTSSEAKRDSIEKYLGNGSATTQNFTSPEFLTAMRHDTKAIATPASDIFALATTLLVAATGESPYVAGRIEMQKLAMVMEGRPMDFARSGENASRILPGGLVDRVLRGGIQKDVKKRLLVVEWKEAITMTLDELKIEV